MRLVRVLLVIMLGGLVFASSAQARCKLEREEHYECDRDVFAKRLAEAKVIRVDASRLDLFAADRTKQLVQKLGKQVAAPDEHADLAFEVAAVDRSGKIDFGPKDIPLARLNVYDTEHHLVWVETLDGQQEIPWSADVIELLKRFQADIAGSKV
jgi:hypothetical protein